jgi:hypothetical protein
MNLTTVIFICPNCSLLYSALQDRFTQESAGRFDCIDCNAEVFSWRGLHDFARWKAVTADEIHC